MAWCCEALNSLSHSHRTMASPMWSVPARCGKTQYARHDQQQRDRQADLVATDDVLVVQDPDRRAARDQRSGDQPGDVRPAPLGPRLRVRQRVLGSCAHPRSTTMLPNLTSMSTVTVT